MGIYRKKPIHEQGVSFCVEMEALYILLLWFLTVLQREEESGTREGAVGILGNRSSHIGPRTGLLRPALHPDSSLLPRPLLETGFRSLTHIPLSGPTVRICLHSLSRKGVLRTASAV